MAARLTSFQLINEDGELNASDFKTFEEGTKLHQHGTSYVLVSIMGPQSSGKSTLLNHLFQTKFEEMKAEERRGQTTKGIWMAKCPNITPFTLIMDVEGTGGQEKEENVSFEKQSALFALVVSDILLVNMWCKDIGREQGACRPLLKLIFGNMLQYFSSAKTTLIFIIRDTTRRTNKTVLEKKVRDDANKIWETVPKPTDLESVGLSNFFNLHVVFLSNYEEREEEFMEEVDAFRKKFNNSLSPGGLAGDRQSVVPASAFSYHVKNIWDKVKNNKDLDIPAHNLMVADFHCSQIAEELHLAFKHDKDWHNLEQDATNSYISTFMRWEALLEKYLRRYDDKTYCFDEGKRLEKKQQLRENSYKLAEGAFRSNLSRLASKTLNAFKTEFDKEIEKGKQHFVDVARKCKADFMSKFDESYQEATKTTPDCWGMSVFRKDLERSIAEYTKSVRAARIDGALKDLEEKLKAALEKKVVGILCHPGSDTWPKIRALFEEQTQKFQEKLSHSLDEYDLEGEERQANLSDLTTRAKGFIRFKATEEARNIEKHFMRILEKHFGIFTRSRRREEEDLDSAKRSAENEGCNLLVAMAFTQLDDETDEIGRELYRALLQEDSDSEIPAIYDKVDKASIITSPELLQMTSKLMKIRLHGVFDAARNSRNDREFHSSLDELKKNATKEQAMMTEKLEEALSNQQKIEKLEDALSNQQKKLEEALSNQQKIEKLEEALSNQQKMVEEFRAQVADKDAALTSRLKDAEDRAARLAKELEAKKTKENKMKCLCSIL